VLAWRRWETLATSLHLRFSVRLIRNRNQPGATKESTRATITTGGPRHRQIGEILLHWDPGLRGKIHGAKSREERSLFDNVAHSQSSISKHGLRTSVSNSSSSTGSHPLWSSRHTKAVENHAPVKKARHVTSFLDCRELVSPHFHMPDLGGDTLIL